MKSSERRQLQKSKHRRQVWYRMNKRERFAWLDRRVRRLGGLGAKLFLPNPARIKRAFVTTEYQKD